MESTYPIKRSPLKSAREVLLPENPPVSSRSLPMIFRDDETKRWRGLVALAVAAGMVHWGDLVLRPMLRGWCGIFYWLVCFGLAVLAVVFGIVDIRRNLEIYRRERLRVLRRLDDNRSKS